MSPLPYTAQIFLYPSLSQSRQCWCGNRLQFIQQVGLSNYNWSWNDNLLCTVHAYRLNVPIIKERFQLPMVIIKKKVLIKKTHMMPFIYYLIFLTPTLRKSDFNTQGNESQFAFYIVLLWLVNCLYLITTGHEMPNAASLNLWGSRCALPIPIM